MTIPYNIAPLNFLLRNEASALQVTVSGQQESLTVHGNRKFVFRAANGKTCWMLKKGQTLTVTITAKVEGKWLQYPTFTWKVVSEKLDSFLSYRLIEPGYEVWNTIQLCERNIETFEEKVIADNNLVDGNCMNCHIYGKQNGNLSLFHLRGKNGGTILNRNGVLRKLSLKNDQMVSGAVYGDFHPSGRYGVFSSNIIIPAYHAQNNKRLEVYDTVSDLVIADFDNNKMLTSPQTARKRGIRKLSPPSLPTVIGLYYCASPAVELPDSLHQLNIPFAASLSMQKKENGGNHIDTLWNAAEHHASVCFPESLSRWSLSALFGCRLRHFSHLAQGNRLKTNGFTNRPNQFIAYCKFRPIRYVS